MSLLSVLRPRPRQSAAHPPSRALSRQWHYQPPPEGLIPPPRRVPIPGSHPVAYQLEDRRDCQQCGGERDVLVRANGYQCVRHQHITLT